MKKTLTLLLAATIAEVALADENLPVITRKLRPVSPHNPYPFNKDRVIVESSQPKGAPLKRKSPIVQSGVTCSEECFFKDLNSRWC